MVGHCGSKCIFSAIEWKKDATFQFLKQRCAWRKSRVRLSQNVRWKLSENDSSSAREKCKKCTPQPMQRKRECGTRCVAWERMSWSNTHMGVAPSASRNVGKRARQRCASSHRTPNASIAVYDFTEIMIIVVRVIEYCKDVIYVFADKEVVPCPVCGDRLKGAQYLPKEAAHGGRV